MIRNPRWHRYALVLLALGTGFAASAQAASATVSRIERQGAVGQHPDAPTPAGRIVTTTTPEPPRNAPGPGGALRTVRRSAGHIGWPYATPMK